MVVFRARSRPRGAKRKMYGSELERANRATYQTHGRLIRIATLKTLLVMVVSSAITLFLCLFEQSAQPFSQDGLSL
jgi:hypothetical protein